MSVEMMSLVFDCDMPEIKTDKGQVVPDTTAKSVLLALANFANLDGEGSYPGVDTLCRKTNYSTSTVCNALNALRTNGFIALVGKSKRDTNNYTVSAARVLEFQWPKRSDSSHRNGSVSAAETNPSITINKPSNSVEGETDKKPIIPEGFPIEWLIAHGMPVDQAQVNKLVKAKEACDKFEQVFGFHSLPWSVNGPWEQFERWVVKIDSEQPSLFQEYVDWSKGQGKYKHMSNKQIRTNPLMFIDTGYPEFEASKMYADKPARKGSGKQSPDEARLELAEWLKKEGVQVDGIPN